MKIENQVDTQDNMVNADDSDLKEIMPAMNVSVPAPQIQQQEENLISDEALLGIYSEIFTKIRDDRTEIDDFISKFADMVFNEGDATTSTKEALVNLVKLKSDSADKLRNVAELMTRVKLKERDTFPRYLAAHQNNTINIEGNGARRALLREINKAQKKLKDKE